jgi:DNA-binding LacI/PurR family transcriptional regulator
LAAVNSLSAFVALSAPPDAGLDLPAGLAVTGYDDTFLAELRQISLTSVNPDSAGMGELAARRLLERIARPDRPGVEHLVAPRLVIRASSAQPIPRSAGGPPRSLIDRGTPSGFPGPLRPDPPAQEAVR